MKTAVSIVLRTQQQNLSKQSEYGYTSCGYTGDCHAEQFKKGAQRKTNLLSNARSLRVGVMYMLCKPGKSNIGYNTSSDYKGPGG